MTIFLVKVNILEQAAHVKAARGGNGKPRLTVAVRVDAADKLLLEGLDSRVGGKTRVDVVVEGSSTPASLLFRALALGHGGVAAALLAALPWNGRAKDGWDPVRATTRGAAEVGHAIVFRD